MAAGSSAASAAIVHSTIASGRTASIDTSAAEAAPGVLAVLTHRNAPRVEPPDESSLPLQDERIDHAGQPVALVVAETLGQAARAGALVAVDYEPAPLAAGGAIAAAPVRIDRTYSAPHDPGGPHTTTAVWDRDGRLTLYETARHVIGARRLLSSALDLPPSHVVVVSRLLGGSLGRKACAWPRSLLAALAASTVRRPVRVAQTSADPLTATIALGAEADGRLTGVHEPCGAPPGLGRFALECAMDELALAAGVDPVALRLANDAPDGLRACLADGAERFGWEARTPEPGSMRDGDELVGLGVATATRSRRRGSLAVFAEVRARPDQGVLRVSRLLAASDGRLGDATRSMKWGARQALPGSGAGYEADVLFVGDTAPLGARSLGELAATAVAPAVANAVHHATGRRVRDLPITLEKLRGP